MKSCSEKIFYENKYYQENSSVSIRNFIDSAAYGLAFLPVRPVV